MSTEDKHKKDLSRREFLKGAGLGVAAIAGGSVLSGCKPKGASEGEVEEQASTGFSFETPPEPIAEKEITDTVTADVVVIGAGVAGVMAAMSAAQAGASTVLLEKSETYNARGGHNAALGSKLQKANGIDYDANEVINALVRWSGHKVDQRLLMLWANNVNETIDLMIDMAEAEGMEVTLWGNDVPDAAYPEYKTVHMFGGMDEKNVTMLCEKAFLEAGGEVYYSTPAAQLEREDGGRVTGVIAGEPGAYTRFVANNGVILCTGDYGNDPELVARYCPKAADVDMNVYAPQVNTGDGHKMGMWIGAAMQEEDPAATVMHNLGALTLTSNPFLRVNGMGERYENEDVPLTYMVNKIQLLPDNTAYTIFDSTYGDELANFTPSFARVTAMSDSVQEELDTAVEAGTTVFKADTIEELAAKLNVPAANLKATVDRYNELAANGEDVDFGKDPSILTPVDTAPFYGARITVALLVVLGGLNTNTDLEVLDTEGNVIPGLYAAGNTVGNFFANDYPVIVPGLSHSRALVFGRLAGQTAANV